MYRLKLGTFKKMLVAPPMSSYELFSIYNILTIVFIWLHYVENYLSDVFGRIFTVRPRICICQQ